MRTALRFKKISSPLAVIPALALAGVTTGCGFFPPISSSSTGCTASSTCSVTTSYMYAINEVTSAPAVAGLTLTTSVQAASGTTPASTVLTLTGTPSSNYALSVVPNAMAITPTNTFLYISSLVGGIYVYAVNSDFSITLQSSISPVATTVAPQSIVVDPSGKWLLVLNASTATTQAAIDVYAIDSSTGALTSSGTATVQTAGVSQQIAIAPSETSIGANSTLGLVAVTLGAGGIETYTFNNSTGALGFAGHLAPGGTLNQNLGVTIDPTSTYLLETETVASVVRVFTINKTTGGLSQAPGSPYAVGTGPSAVLVSASGGYVYVANQTSNTISGFTLGTGGTLTAITGSPFATGTTPVALVEDSTKSYIGVVCQGGNPDLEIYSFDTTTGGKLDSAKSVSTGTDPTLAGAIVATQ